MSHLRTTPAGTLPAKPGAPRRREIAPSSDELNLTQQKCHPERRPRSAPSSACAAITSQQEYVSVAGFRTPHCASLIRHMRTPSGDQSTRRPTMAQARLPCRGVSARFAPKLSAAVKSAPGARSSVTNVIRNRGVLSTWESLEISAAGRRRVSIPRQYASRAPLRWQSMPDQITAASGCGCLFARSLSTTRPGLPGVAGTGGGLADGSADG
jgi:hypothetical protein